MHYHNTGDLLEGIGEFEKIIGYSFNNRNHVLLALTHSSFANEIKSGKVKSNERLEFLGDAVLNIVMSEEIYMRYAQLTEGEMTRVRANVVCETSLTKCANNIGIGHWLLLGKGEELTGGRSRISILSDAFEALIGAIYLDGGMQNAREFVLRQVKQMLEDSANGVIMMDYKTQLQEVVQRNGEKKIVYEVVEEKGPDHNKLFIMQVKVSEAVWGTGEGKSKKEAEQNAARVALERKKSGFYD